MNKIRTSFAAAASVAALLGPFVPAHAQTTPSTVKIDHPWARTTVPGQGTGTAFMGLQNTGKTPDRLLGGSTAAADHVELHTMSMDGAVMKMRQIPAIDLPPGKSVSLTPATTHMMLLGLKAPLALGASVPLTLHFEKAGDVTVQLRIEPMTFGTDAPMH